MFSTKLCHNKNLFSSHLIPFKYAGYFNKHYLTYFRCDSIYVFVPVRAKFKGMFLSKYNNLKICSVQENTNVQKSEKRVFYSSI